MTSKFLSKTELSPLSSFQQQIAVTVLTLSALSAPLEDGDLRLCCPLQGPKDLEKYLAYNRHSRNICQVNGPLNNSYCLLSAYNEPNTGPNTLHA